jgi:glutamate-1-semialdehyde 2,1-aminomutase
VTKERPRSKRIFKRAEKLLVGGVNSPVRAFRAVGGAPLALAKGAGASMVLTYHAKDVARWVKYC